MHVILRFIEKGWNVSLPFGENQRYDVILDNGSDLFKVQVKTGRLSNGVIQFPFRSSTSIGTKRYFGEVDLFAVYCPETREVYMVPVEDPQVCILRVEDPKGGNTSKINWAKDYLLNAVVV